MSKIFDVTALGELLIDFTPSYTENCKNEVYEANPGGAPANVLTVIANMGYRAALISKVGKDHFGSNLIRKMAEIGVNTDSVIIDHEIHTTLAFVSLNDDGNRSFSFCRNPGADCVLTRDEIVPHSISESRIFHFGSLSLTNEPIRAATNAAIQIAKDNGLIISFDPNVRLNLWRSKEEALQQITLHLNDCDILKISDEECEFLTGEKDIETGARLLIDQYHIALVFITMGADGAYYCSSRFNGIVATEKVKAVDTTGAGDAFMGAVLTRILEANVDLHQLTEEQIKDIVLFANACGTLTTLNRGGIPAIPTREDLKEYYQMLKNKKI